MKLFKKEDDFLEILMRLEVQEVIGAARILGIDITKEWDGFELIQEMNRKFNELNRKRRRELIKILRAAGGK